MTIPAWLRNEPPADVTTLDRNALLDVWAANRNNLLAAMAADEMMKRLTADRNQQETKK